MDYDKTTRKLFKYLHKNRDKGVFEEEIYKKFGNNCKGMYLINLALESYLIAQNPDKSFTMFSDQSPPYATEAKTKWFTTPKANVLIEGDRKELKRWLVPVIISLVAIIISIGGVIISLLNKSPVDVRLLQDETYEILLASED